MKKREDIKLKNIFIIHENIYLEEKKKVILKIKKKYLQKKKTEQRYKKEKNLKLDYRHLILYK